MKLNKIFAVAVAGLSLAACSNDKEVVSFNTLDPSKVEVSMGQAEITVKENRGLFDVPIYVQGERNGCVSVTVEVEEVGEYPAIEDHKFYITTKTINIPANEDFANLEIATVVFPDPEPDLTFRINIKDVKYGTQVGLSSTLVTIVDRGIAPLADAIPNVWDCTCMKDANGTEVNWTSSMTLVPAGTVGDDGKPSEYDVLSFTDWMGEQVFTCPIEYRYDKAENWGDFYIPNNTIIGSNLNFGDPIGTADVAIQPQEGSVLVGQWNDDFTGISFGGTAILAIINAPVSGYYYSYMNDLSMKAAQ